MEVAMSRINQKGPSRKELLRRVAELEKRVSELEQNPAEGLAPTNVGFLQLPKLLVEDALSEWAEQLSTCSRHYRSPDPARRLEAAQGFAVCTGSFIGRLAFPREYSEIAFHLTLALQGVEIGAIDPMLKNPLSNRAQDDQMSWYARGALALAVIAEQKFCGVTDKWSSACCISVLERAEQLVRSSEEKTTLTCLLVGDPTAPPQPIESLGRLLAGYHRQLPEKQRAPLLEEALKMLRGIIDSAAADRCSGLSQLLMRMALQKLWVGMKKPQLERIAS